MGIPFMYASCVYWKMVAYQNVTLGSEGLSVMARMLIQVTEMIQIQSPK